MKTQKQLLTDFYYLLDKNDLTKKQGSLLLGYKNQANLTHLKRGYIKISLGKRIIITLLMYLDESDHFGKIIKDVLRLKN